MPSRSANGQDAYARGQVSSTHTLEYAWPARAHLDDRAVGVQRVKVVVEHSLHGQSRALAAP